MNKAYSKSSFLEDNQNGRHIVATYSSGGISSYQCLQQILNYFSLVRFFLELLVYNIYNALVVIDVTLPNTVTTNQYERVIVVSGKFTDIRLANNQLLVIGKLLVLLIVEVTERTSKV